MVKPQALIALLLLTAPAPAQQVRIPTEEEKIIALKQAYRLNGNSMVGPMIDLTDPLTRERARLLDLSAPSVSASPPFMPPPFILPSKRSNP